MPTQSKKTTKKKSSARKINYLGFAVPINRRLALVIVGVVVAVGIIAVGISGASSKSNPYFAACQKLHPSGLPTLKAGDKGVCVQAAQYTMQYFGVKITGVYDTKTVQVVNFLQSLQKVSVSGQINAPMWAYLFGNPYATKCHYPYPVITPTKNNSGACVSFLQWQLIDNGYTKNMAITGKYDKPTQTGIELMHYVLKDSAGTPETVDATIWVALLDYQKVYVAPKVTPTPVPAPSVGTQAAQMPTLSFGATGSAVANVQSRLCVNPDGQFGPQTLNAVQSFQRRNGLSPDGVVGPATWAKLLAVGTQCQAIPTPTPAPGATPTPTPPAKTSPTLDGQDAGGVPLTVGNQGSTGLIDWAIQGLIWLPLPDCTHAELEQYYYSDHAGRLCKAFGTVYPQ